MAFNTSDLAATEATEPKRGRKAKAVDNGQPEPGASPVQTVVIEAPIHTCLKGYASTHFNFHATDRQAAAAKLLWSSLSDRSDRFQGGRSLHPDGKVVENHGDGVRWLLDRLADAIEDGTGKNLLADFDLTFR